MEQIIHISIGYLLLINLVTFTVFGIDKFQAIRKKSVRRVSEFTLLLFSFLGGSAAALFGIAYFRHKISKNSFLFKFAAVVLIQVVIIAAIYHNLALVG